jgi:hypothetical protein
MKTGPYQFPGRPYPGVYFAGDDALAIAGALAQTADEDRERTQYGAMSKDYALKRVIEILKSCEVK